MFFAMFSFRRFSKGLSSAGAGSSSRGIGRFFPFGFVDGSAVGVVPGRVCQVVNRSLLFGTPGVGKALLGEELEVATEGLDSSKIACPR
jgi:hypothetical protein